jgi:hypothetical protein
MLATKTAKTDPEKAELNQKPDEMSTSQEAPNPRDLNVTLTLIPGDVNVDPQRLKAYSGDTITYTSSEGQEFELMFPGELTVLSINGSCKVRTTGSIKGKYLCKMFVDKGEVTGEYGGWTDVP